MNKNLAKAAAVGALGGFLFGFDTAVISGTTQALTAVYHLTPGQLGLTVSMALIGTVIGAMTAGIPGQKYGGRETLRFLAICYVVSALGCAFAWNWYVLLAARFIGGIGIGGSSVLGPVYIAELAPAKLRGRLVGMFQINIVIGILMAYLSNYIIASFGLGDAEWRWQLGIAALPAIIFLILLFGIPPSSRWLVTQKRVDEARGVLQSMGAEDTEGELREIVDSIHLDKLQTSEPLFAWKYRLPIFLAITIGMFNQLSGINAILYYLNDIFAAAGYSKISGGLQAVAIGGMNLVATLAENAFADRRGGHVGVPVRGRGGFLLSKSPEFPAVAAGGIHRVLRDFAGCGDLGLHRRGVSEPRAGKGAGAGKLRALGNECVDRLLFPAGREGFGRRAVRAFWCDDAGAVCCGAAVLSGDQGRQPGAVAA